MPSIIIPPSLHEFPSIIGSNLQGYNICDVLWIHRKY